MVIVLVYRDPLCRWQLPIRPECLLNAEPFGEGEFGKKEGMWLVKGESWARSKDDFFTFLL